MYNTEEIQILREIYNPIDVRSWPFYPIVMPLLDGQGPASDLECDEITWEVWDQFYNSYSSFEYLPDAINDALLRNKQLFEVL